MRKLLLAFSICALIMAPELISAQNLPGMDASPADIAVFPYRARGNDVGIKVVYSRPQLKGRKMLGDKEPYGKVWRLGANETTEITLYKDMMIGGQSVEAGTYSLYAIPNEKEWEFIINSNLNTWGAYQYDESADVARFTVPATSTDSEVEAFTIAFLENDPNMTVAWGNTMVKVPVK